VVRIYLDHNATTPLRDEVAEAMARVLRDCYGNPSSVHAEGEAARAVVDAAREQVAALLGAAPGEVIFTAGATEANNTALWGVLRARAGGGRRLQVVSSNVEHPSVEAPLQALEREGHRVTRLPVDGEGLLDPARVAAALGPETALLSILWANNETGVVQPLREIAAEARARGVPVHADATQAVGKLPVDLRELPLDLLSLSAHKLNGPKGVGALVVRGELAFEPLLQGGPQEGRRRGGTENVAGIAGLGIACELARRELPERQRAWAALRDRLWEGIRARIPRAARNGSAQHTLCNTLNVAFEGCAGEVLLQALDLEGVAVSAGAACASGSVEPSPVLLAMGLAPARARGSLRMSVGHGVEAAQIDRVLELLPAVVERARARRAA
jgi:cysteine desulfurase